MRTIGSLSNALMLVNPGQGARLQECLSAVERMAAGGGRGETWDESWARPYAVQGGTLAIPVKGVLLHDFPYQFGNWATGYEYIRAATERGLADPAVERIALEFNSPGGMVSGVFDLADWMAAQRKTKPLAAFLNEGAHSAAYLLASAAGAIVIPRTGSAGSIGVVRMHVDTDRAIESAGYRVTFVHSGKCKVDGNPFEPLPAEVRKRWQAESDAVYALFVDAVARNRRVSAAAVRATEARTFMADEALKLGLVDRIGPHSKTMSQFSNGGAFPALAQ